YLVEDLEHARGQKRPLLVLSGQLPALRRCLRTLCRLAPPRAREIIVVAGGTGDFHAGYRAPAIASPVQDPPRRAVLFFHHHPLGPALLGTGPENKRDDVGPVGGLDDVALYKHIVQTLQEAVLRVPEPTLLHAGALREELQHLGQFDATGNRQTLSGEHLVHLEPAFDDDRLLLKATLEIWTRSRRDLPWECKRCLP